MAYSSRINTRLGEVPKTSDGEAFADLVDIYNAIHIVSQYTATLTNRANPEEGLPMWEAMSFNNVLWFKAGESLETGHIVHIRSSGAWRGISNDNPTMRYDSREGYGKVYGGLHISAAMLWGLSLNEADAGDMVKVGFGMAVINMEGITFGDKLYAAGAKESLVQWNSVTGHGIRSYRAAHDGSIYKNVAHYVAEPILPDRWAQAYVQIGTGVGNDAAMIWSPEWTRAVSVSRDIAWA